MFVVHNRTNRWHDDCVNQNHNMIFVVGDGPFWMAEEGGFSSQ